jgi:hypothetical protein
LIEIKGIDDTVLMVENYLSLQLLRPVCQKAVLELQEIFLKKGERALFSAATGKGAEVKHCWRCRKDLPILHNFCTACAWHLKFAEYYEDDFESIT